MNSPTSGVLWIAFLAVAISVPAVLIARSFRAERKWLLQIIESGLPAKARVVSITSQRLASGGGGATLQSDVEVEFSPKGATEAVRVVRTFKQAQSLLPWRSERRHPAVEAIVYAEVVDIHYHPKWPTMIAFDHEV